MARSEVTVKPMSLNAENLLTLDAYDTSNNHSIDVSTVQSNKLLIGFNTNAASAGTITFNYGDYSAGSQGDLVLSVGSTVAEYAVVEVETARFKDEDGLILIDLATTGTFAGFIWAAETV